MLRKILVTAAAAGLLGSVFMVSDADARGGMRTGGFRTGGPSFRAAGPSFRTAGPAFRGPVGPAFRGTAFRGPGMRFANPGFRRSHHFRRFGFIGAPYFAAYGAYPYYDNYDNCVVPRRVATPWGWRVQWVNACYDTW